MKKQAILAFSGKEPANVLQNNKPPRQESLFYPIAGIGASNGGLKALEQSCDRYRTRAAGPLSSSRTTH
jgi:chemotaxis response regulator CheB